MHLLREVYGDGPNVGKKRSFGEMWCTVVYELYNIASAEDFGRLDLQASSGELSKEQFVIKRFEVESRAEEKTRSFYIHVFLPWSKEHHIATDPSSWYLATKLDTSEDSVPRNADRTSSRWRNYEDWYDTLVAKTKMEKRKAKKTAEGTKNGTKNEGGSL